MGGALGVHIREDDAPVIATLEDLERNFRPLQDAIPFGASPWTGPDDIE
jgi:hypothetical protein